MKRRSLSIDAATARASVAAREANQSVLYFDDISVLDSIPPGDDELEQISDWARLAAAAGGVGFLGEKWIAVAVGSTARERRFDAQGNHELPSWGDVSGAIVASLFRLLFLYRHRPKWVKRILGRERVRQIESMLETHFAEAYRDFPGSRKPATYTSKLISRRAYTNRDTIREYALPIRYSLPSLRSIWRQNRRVVRDWPDEKLEARMAELKSLIEVDDEPS